MSRWKAALLAALLVQLSRCAVDPDADPWPLPFSTELAIGPDGPWNAIDQPVGFPQFSVALLPSLTQQTTFVPSGACSELDSACPLPLPGMWESTDAQALVAYENSNDTDAADWETDVMDPLQIRGTLYHVEDRIVLAATGDRDTGYLDGSAITIADNFTVAYPGGARYTLDVGFLSLWGAWNTSSWTNTSGSSVVATATLPNAYLNGLIPSISYGLHLGSSSPNVTGSLYLGGYDASRALTTPITSMNQTFQLVDLTLNISSGVGLYGQNTTRYDFSPSLLSDSSEEDPVPLTVLPNPGVPSLYLPSAVCARLATYLPITYSSAFNLYLWNTSSPRYARLLTSTHFLNFTFASTNSSSSSISSIALPLTLLNLNLTSPLVSTPTPYLPCTPYTPSSTSGPFGAAGTYHLGRAFLQGAFLGANWQTSSSSSSTSSSSSASTTSLPLTDWGTTFLAQAPGPVPPSLDVKTIARDTTRIPATAGAPAWPDTWAGVLTPVTAAEAEALGLVAADDGDDDDTTTGTHGASSADADSGGLSTGAKAGVAVGVVVGALALLGALGWWIVRRRRRRQQRMNGGGGAAGEEQRGTAGDVEGKGEFAVMPSEMDGRPSVLEFAAVGPVTAVAEVSGTVKRDFAAVPVVARPVELPVD